MATTLELIMIIDDHDVSNFIAQQIIINSGITKRTIIQPAAFSALKYLEKNSHSPADIPQLIFLDLDMPVVDGIEFLKEFEQISTLVAPSTKIVILSGYDKKSTVKPWIDKGIVIDYMQKPLSLESVQDFMKSNGFKKHFSTSVT